MGIRAPLVMSLCLIAAMLAVGAWVWPQIPETARLAVHWGADGRPNGYMHREAALAIAPLTAAGFTLAFALIARFGRNIASSAAAFVAGWLGTLVMLTVAHFAIAMLARGDAADVPGCTSFIAALFFIVVGNFLGKTRPNSFVGVRTPWSKKSDAAWDKSNRAAGRMTVAVGLASLAALVTDGAGAARHVLLFGILAMAVISTVLSYVYYRRDPERREEVP